MNDDLGATGKSDNFARFKGLCRDVGVNALANVLAVPIIYLVGAAVGIFRRVPAALVVSASVLALALMLASLAAMFLAMRESRVPSPGDSR